MNLRPLGKTGIQISHLSLGGLFTSSLAGGIDESRRIVRRAIELGINAIDTAPSYADSEEVLGQVLRGIRTPLILTTKLGGRPKPFDARDASGLVQSVETSLQLLGRDSVDLLMIHEPDRPLQYPWWTSYDPLDGPALEVIDQLKLSGKIRFAGLAGTTTSELASLIRSDRFENVLTAFNYNALVREAAEEVIPEATGRQMGIIAGSIYGQGFLGRRFDEELKSKPDWMSEKRRLQFLAFYSLLDECGMSITEMCLRFAIGNPHLSTVLVGCKTMSQLETSVAHFTAGPLPGDVSARLDEIAAMVPGRPFEEPMILPFGKPYHGPGMANLGAGVPVGKL